VRTSPAVKAVRAELIRVEPDPEIDDDVHPVDVLQPSTAAAALGTGGTPRFDRAVEAVDVSSDRLFAGLSGVKPRTFAIPVPVAATSAFPEPANTLAVGTWTVPACASTYP
jgi:hypothetical protein